MDKSKYIQLEVLKVSQKIGAFFLTKMIPADLFAIANKNLSRIKNIESGIQREVKEGKVQQIKKYISEADATFPNTIILAIQNNPASVEPSYVLSEDGTVLQILRADDVANVLDGQHRLSAFAENTNDFELPVAVFLDLSLGEQAKIFATINSTQTKVDLSLVYELFGITDERSPERTAFHIVSHLNNDVTSAWRGKIKTLTDKSGDLSQGAMAKYFHKELLEKDPIFKRLFEEKRDTDIKNILMNYFNAIAETFPHAWANENKNYVLTKTTGFNGFMIFFRSLVALATAKKEKVSKDFFLGYLNRSRDSFGEIIAANFPSGVSGQQKIRDILRASLTEEERNIAGIRIS